MKVPAPPSATVLGIILGYAAGRGIVLCQHKSAPTIEVTFDMYEKHPKDRHWFAHFHWLALEAVDRDALQAEFQNLKGVKVPRRRKKEKEPNVTLDAVLVGRVVRCVVVKSPTWQVSEMTLAKDHVRFKLSDRHRKPPIIGQKSSVRDEGPAGVPDRRKAAASRPGSNIRHPWRG